MQTKEIVLVWIWLKDGAELLLLTDKLLAEKLPHFYSQKAFIHSFSVYPSLDLVCLVRYFYLHIYPGLYAYILCA